MADSRKSIVFLDRDGTINVDTGYITTPTKLKLLPGAAEAIAALRANGFEIVIVTNQSAVARGMATEQDVINTNTALQEMLSKESYSAIISQVLYAIDHPDRATDRRKPGIGMLRDLNQELQNFDSATSWMIGDKVSDVEFGINAGLPASQCILIVDDQRTKSVKLSEQLRQQIKIVGSLAKAAKLIING